MRGSSGMPCGRDLSISGLTCDGVKTRLIEFGRYADERRRRRGLAGRKPSSSWGSSSSADARGEVVSNSSASPGDNRMRAKLHEIKATLRKHLHAPLPEQGKWLRAVLNGYFAYHAVPTNMRSLQSFRQRVASAWRRVLSRRSQKARINWERMMRIADAWLPQPPNPSSVARPTLCRQSPKVGAECLNWARSDLCGGCPVMGIPTAISSFAAASISRPGCPATRAA